MCIYYRMHRLGSEEGRLGMNKQTTEVMDDKRLIGEQKGSCYLLPFFCLLLSLYLYFLFFLSLIILCILFSFHLSLHGSWPYPLL